MYEFVRVSLALVCLLPIISCGQEAEVAVDGVRFVQGSIPVETGQKEAAAGDVTGDGHPDVIVAIRDSVTVLRGDGTGGFERHARVPAGPNPTGPALADLNDDGHTDIAVANHETQSLTLLRGDGQGNFEAFPHSPLTIDVEPHPHAVRATDIDGDGLVDLVVDHRAGEGLLVLPGTGNGQFESPGTLVAGGGDPYRGMVAADLTGDGQTDLVTPNPDAVGIMLRLDSNELSFSQDEIPTDAGPFAVNVADLNGDGQQDVIAALDEGSPLVQVFLGDGQGSFREATHSPFPFSGGGKMIVPGDFNGDGVEDAAVTCWNATEVLLLLGGRDSIRTSMLPAQGNPWGPAAADVNGDRIDDLIIPDAASDQLLTYISRADGNG